MLIGICGDIGVGKTTATRVIANTIGHTMAHEVNFADALKYACTVAFSIHPWFLSTAEGKQAPLPMHRFSVGANSPAALRVFASSCIVSLSPKEVIHCFGDEKTFIEEIVKRGAVVLGDAFGFEQDKRLMEMMETDPLGVKHHEYIVPITGRRLLQLLGTEVGRAYDPDMWVKIALCKAERSHKLGAKVVMASDLRFDSEFLAIKRSGGKIIRITRGSPAESYSHSSEGNHWKWEADYVLTNDGDQQSFAADVALLASGLTHQS